MAWMKWLLDADPAIRWQVMRDLTHEPDEAVAAERARVASEGWGARLLALQTPGGQWGGSEDRGWMSTIYTLALLKDLGVDPTSPPVRKAIDLILARITWWQLDGRPFFDGETEPCINGAVLAARRWWLELQCAWQQAHLVPHHDLRPGRTARVRAGARCFVSGDAGSPARTRLSAAAAHAALADLGCGDRSRLDAVLIPDNLALRRASGSRLLPKRWRGT